MASLPTRVTWRRPSPGFCRHLAWVLLVASASAAFAGEAEVSTALAGGQTVQQELAAGSTDSLVVDADTGQFLHLTVEPDALSLTVTITGPDGTLLARTRDPWGDGWTRLRLSTVAAVSGPHRVSITASASRAPSDRGAYRLAAADLRPATAADQLRLQNEAALEAARDLASASDPETRRRAFDRYAAVRERWRELDDVWGEASALKETADLHHRLGAPGEAVPNLEQALALYARSGDLRGQAVTLNDLGAMAYELGDARPALDTYERALALFREAGNRRGEAATLVNIGGAHGALGEQDRALAAYETALVLARAARVRRVEGYALRNMGGLLLALGDLDQGLETMRQALEIGRQFDDGALEAYALSIMARGFRLKGDLAQAVGFAGQAVQRWRSLGNRLAVGQSLVQLGAAQRALGSSREAEESLRSALEHTRAAGAVFGETAALLELAKVQEATGQLDEARQTLDGALASARASGNTAAESEALYRTAVLRRAAGDVEGALGDVDAALAFKESHRSRVSRADLRGLFFASAQDVYEFQIDLLAEMASRRGARADLVTRAFEASERKRSRALLDSIVEDRASLANDADPQLRAEARRAADRLRALHQRQARMESSRHTREQAAALARAIDDAVRAHEASQRRLEEASPRYAAFLLGAVATAADVQALLDGDTVLVELSLGDSRSHAWAVTRDGIEAFTLPPRAQLTELARAAWDSLAIPSGQDPVGHARPAIPPLGRLARALLGPLAGRLQHRRVVVVADGPLQHVAFAALPEPAGPHAGQPLLANHEVVVVPSASILKALRLARRRPASTRTVAVFADPVFERDDPRVAGVSPARAAAPRARDLVSAARAAGLTGAGGTFPRLPFSRREADAIVEAAGPASVLRAVDFQANRAAALSPRLGDFGIVHFASHGLIDSDRPERSGIVLSLVDDRGRPQDGYLRLEDIHNLKLRADLVVLSACQTALGREVRGEGLVGMVRAFMYAGAPRVVASLWNVDDRATAALMEEFYGRLLRAGEPPAAALRRAQLAVRARPQWRHPFYWAGFVLQGEWR
jgi:CHAT domain-containing protein/tetratricopeptide (TPR) repeat protein